jgi:AraC-like DNA-binding protein
MQTIENIRLNRPNRKSFITNVNFIIESNLSNESFCVADLQSSLLMSNSQIYRKIKKKTGYSPSTYIRIIRLQHAYNLIQKSELSLSEIAYSSGFNSLSYFSKSFSKYFGMAPSTLRYAN